MNRHHPLVVVLLAMGLIGASLIRPAAAQEQIIPQPGDTDLTDNRINIGIQPVGRSGYPIANQCFELVGDSNIGCDDNHDGIVIFQDIPFGNYTVRYQGSTDGTDLPIVDRQITVTQLDAVFFVMAEDDQPISSTIISPDVTTTTDLNVITRDPATGHALTDVCYQLVGDSNIGCDDNGDGRVHFADIPPGEYVIRQTTTPAGYPPMNDVPVQLSASWAQGHGQTAISIPLAQQADQGRTLSIVSYFQTNTQSLPVLGACYRLANTETGCDNDVVDGQVDFINIATGDLVITETTTSCPFGNADIQAIDRYDINERIQLWYVPVPLAEPACIHQGQGVTRAPLPIWR